MSSSTLDPDTKLNTALSTQQEYYDCMSCRIMGMPLGLSYPFPILS
jgi:hypothetical protein